MASPLSALPAMRAMAESLMTAQCVVRRKAGERRDGVRLVVQWEKVYEGRCKLQTYEGHERTAAGSASTSLVEQRSSVHFPVGAFLPNPGDVVQLTASTDRLLLGRIWRITQRYPVKEHATSYRAFVDELIGDEMSEFEGVGDAD